MGESPAPPHRENTAAVVVAYFPPPELPALLASLAAQLRRVVLIDNTPGREPATAAALPANLDTIVNGENRGLATALNQGIARNADCEWLLFFDQDSEVPEDFFERLARAVASGPDVRTVGIHSARYTDDPRALAVAPPEWRETDTVITAGSLIRRQVFTELSTFREDFFIDQIDHEFSLRTRSRGLRNFVTREPLFVHRIGRPRERRLAGHRYRSLGYPPVRWYHAIRNFLWLRGLYPHGERTFFARERRALWKRFARDLPHAESKGQLLCAALRALRHGWTRRPVAASPGVDDRG